LFYIDVLKISINLSFSIINIIKGTYGPFKPNKQIKIPLWLAVQLKKNKKCDIKTPNWFNKDFLSEILKCEKENPTLLQSLPYYFYEITQIIFHV